MCITLEVVKKSYCIFLHFFSCSLEQPIHVIAFDFLPFFMLQFSINEAWPGINLTQPAIT